MRKSKERQEIEALSLGERIEFPSSQYVKISRIVTRANTTARARGICSPEDIMFSIDGKSKKNKVRVIRNM